MYKVLIIGVLAIGALLFGYFAFAKGESQEVLIVGIEADYPPYAFLDPKGKPRGFDIDVIYALAEKIDSPLVIKQLSWDALILALKQGKIDLIFAGMTITPKRLQEIAMIPYHGNRIKHFAFVSKEQTIDFFTASGPIAVLSGSPMHDWLSKQPGLQVKPLGAVSDLLLDMHYGKSIGALVETHSLKGLHKQLPDLHSQLVPLGEDATLGMGIGLRKEDSHTFRLVEAAVQQIRDDGTLQQLEEKWFEEAQS